MPTLILRFKIFVSCPGDVEAERLRVEKFFKNAEGALEKKGIPANLVPLHWKSIVHQFDGTRGQTVINNEFDQYDYYVGILAARFGTPTTTEEGIKYGSGTEEEFRLACKKKDDSADIGMYVFFKNVTVPTDPDKKGQYDQVIRFKREIQPKGWVNNYDEPVDLTDKLNVDLIPEIEKRITEYQTGVVRDFVAKAEVTEVVTAEGPSVALATLTDDLVAVEGPISRTVTLESERTVTLESEDEITRFIFSEDYTKYLPQLVTEQNRIVLLGNAGSGKSTELGKLVEFYKAPDSIFVPVFSKLNTYKGGPIADFLPEEFKNMPENIAMVVLDGLDEVEQEYFSEALDEIATFSNDRPLLKLVISCRTNFFELSIGADKGYLSDFGITRINEITPSDIIVNLNNSDVDGDAFYREVRKNGYEDIVTKPFFLNILTTVFNKTKSLAGGRDKIFAQAIHLKLDNSVKNTGRPEINREHVYRLLTRLGLLMEYLGRNYLSNEEIIIAISSETDWLMVENSSLMTLTKGKWSFEHNNIQEYFAAIGMGSLNLDQIKNLVSFYPDHKILKPSWLNTLAFLISILSGEKRQQILDWIIDIEPESIIRFEPDRVDGKIRFRVFSAIFQEFQRNGLWVKSNKFTEAELGRFGDTPESLALLKEAIGSIGNSTTNKITALRLLEYFKLESPDDRKAVKDLILQFIAQHEDKPEAVYSAVHVLVGIGLADDATVDQLVARYREQKKPYYRASLYTLINKTNNTDRYVDVFTEGIVIVGNREQDAQKHSLWDETIQLKNAFLKFKEASAINKILEFLGEPYDSHYRYYSDKKDVMESIVKQSIVLYPENTFLFDRVLELFINYSKSSSREYLEIFCDFFDQTNTVGKAFEAVYKTEITKFQRDMLLSLLLSPETSEFLIGEFKGGRLSADSLRNLSQEAYFHSRNTRYESGSATLKTLIEAETDVVFNDAAVSTIQQKRRQNEQNSFNLLFDETGMKEEMERFWKEFGKNEALWNEIWEFANDYERDADTYFPRSVSNIVADFARDNHFTTKEAVDEFLANQSTFEDYRMESVYSLMKGGMLVLTDLQKAAIQDWANRKAAAIDISHSISPDGHINGFTLIIWYFIKRLHITLPEDKMLDFSMFYDYSHGQQEDWYEPIIAQVGIDAFNVRVISNIKSGIQQEKVWANNAEYAMVNNLTETYPFIKTDLIRINEVTSIKEAVAKKYLEITDDQEGLFEILGTLVPQDFRWELFDLLKYGRLKTFIENLLLQILNANEESEADRLEAAKRLTEMANEDGFNYYTDHFFENKSFRHRSDVWFRYLMNLKTLNFLPRLLDLLENSLLPQNTGDVFNRFDGQILDALFQMSIQSEENLKAVTEAIENKIAKHAPDWNYLIPYVQRMEFQYRLNRSADVSFDAALSAINALAF